MNQRILTLGIVLFISALFSGCTQQTNLHSENQYSTAKPWARWWWFASVIHQKDIQQNLDWLKENGFGGVEIAWVYPLNRLKRDTVNITPRQPWQSKELAEIVAFTRDYAEKIGLGVDFTFGTLWPFGDSKVRPEEAVMRYGDSLWHQEITASWEYPVKGLVIDHFNPEAFEKYAMRMLKFLPKPARPNQNACFIDSWEVETRKLWTKDFEKMFFLEYGYDIQPYMDSIYSEAYAGYYYDYMKLISKLTLRFYRQYDSLLNAHGFLSRGQCAGAPCDIMQAYSIPDIPETEALLFEPHFSRIVASSAALSGKNIISSETFTCLYGWPSDHIRQENTADLKLLADALFANGVNQIFWHGKPFTINDTDTIQFYASVHLGKTGKLSTDIKPFNQYLTKVSQYMRTGRTYSTLALYLPQEDAWMKAELPVEKQFKWAWGEYEMRYIEIPGQTRNFNPMWVNGSFLQNSKVKYGLLHNGNQTFSGLYIDVAYMEYNSLKSILAFAEKGLPVFFKQPPKEPGIVKHSGYHEIFAQITRLKNYYSNEELFLKKIKPLVSGKDIPEFWSRTDGSNLYLFFAHPLTKTISFPLDYGQSFTEKTIERKIQISFAGKTKEYTLRFMPYQSILLKMDKNGDISKLDITYQPPVPTVIPREKGKIEKWMVTN